MKYIFTITLLIGVLSLNARGATVNQKMSQMLLPTVRVTVGNEGGSGTLIYSQKGNDGKTMTLVLTAFHVVEDATKPFHSYEIHVEFFHYRGGQIIGTIMRTANLGAWNKAQDIAVLTINDDKTVFTPVAHLAPYDVTLSPFETVYAIGSGTGKPPFPTCGIVGNIDYHMQGQTYIQSSSQIAFGNSGGGLYLYSKERKRYELIGIPTKVSVYSGHPVWHMAWSTPIPLIRDFLERVGLGFVLGEKP